MEEYKNILDDEYGNEPRESALEAGEGQTIFKLGGYTFCVKSPRGIELLVGDDRAVQFPEDVYVLQRVCVWLKRTRVVVAQDDEGKYLEPEAARAALVRSVRAEEARRADRLREELARKSELFEEYLT